MVEDWQRSGFGLYVHWPFCEAKCPYCDFNSHVVKHVDQAQWLNAFCLEMDRVYELTGRRELDSIFFGGGTPSLMLPETVEGIIAHAQKLWGFKNTIEITLEANPSSVEAKRFTDFRLAGVNRVSLGVQSLIPDDLKRLGRLHSVDDALIAIGIAQKEFDRMSFDLIYGRQDQTLEAWEQELNYAISLGTDHLSLYHLTIETGTAFGDRYERGRLNGLPSEDLSVALFETTQDITSQSEFEAYEVSNHAKKGQESKHNLIYWNYGDYIGIGPGAHGRLTVRGSKFATETPLQPGAWLKKTRTDRGATEWIRIEKSDQATEMVLMGLRTSDGVSMSEVNNRYPDSLDNSGIADVLEMGLANTLDGRLIVNSRGRLLLNQIIEKVLITRA